MKRSDFLYNLIYSSLISCCVYLSLYEQMNISEMVILHAVSLVLFSAVFSFIYSLKGKVYLTILACVVTGLFVKDCIVNKITDKFITREPFSIPEEFVILGFMSLICFLLTMLIGRSKKTKIVFFVLLIALLVALMIFKEPVSHIGVSLIFILVFCLGIELFRPQTQISGNDGRSYFVYLWPVIVLFTVIMCVSPYSEEPYDWPVAKSIGRKIGDIVYDITHTIFFRGSDDFGISMTGYGDDADVEGELEESARLYLQIQRSSSVNDLYLRGKTYSKFEGMIWKKDDLSRKTSISGKTKKSIDISEYENEFDTIETLSALKRSGVNYSDFVRRRDMSVIQDRFSTQTVFAPLKRKSLTTDEDVLFANADIAFEKTKGMGTSYNTDFYMLNQGHRSFSEMIEYVSANNGYSAKTMGLVLSELDLDRDIYTESSLNEYHEYIYDKYLTEVSVSSELKEILDGIIDKTDNDYEKLKKIEQLLKTCSYTLRPGPLPEYVQDESDYLDYVLISGREGYCSYFAGAFVLLARYYGIPARYVQGLVAHENSTSVRSGDAHAWAEAYINGFGFLTFDPTPGYGDSLNRASWFVQGEYSSEMPEQKGSSPQEYNYEEVQELAARKELELKQKLERERKEREERKHKVIVFSIVTVIIIISLLAVFFISDLLITGNKKKKRKGTDEFVFESARVIYILEMLKYKRSEFETLTELKAKLPYILHSLTLYENYVYGGANITPEMIKTVRNDEKLLLSELKKTRRAIYPVLYFRIYLFNGKIPNGGKINERNDDKRAVRS